MKLKYILEFNNLENQEDMFHNVFHHINIHFEALAKDKI